MEKEVGSEGKTETTMESALNNLNFFGKISPIVFEKKTPIFLISEYALITWRTH